MPWGPEESEATMGAAKLLEMPVVLRESGQGRLSFAGLQSSGTEAWASREEKEALNQVCVGNKSLLV